MHISTKNIKIIKQDTEENNEWRITGTGAPQPFGVISGGFFERNIKQIRNALELLRGINKCQ